MSMVDYQKEMENILLTECGGDKRKRLLLHSCCAPCSSYVITYLLEYFDLTVFFYNPNITDEGEYLKRLGEQRRLIGILRKEFGRYIGFLAGDYEPNIYIDRVNGMESLPEGGARCVSCFEMRLNETAKLAKRSCFDYFTTTLTVSPHKNAECLNNIGADLAKLYGVKFLPSDFKKKDGYKKSIELSTKYGLYRQNYCGCNWAGLET